MDEDAEYFGNPIVGFSDKGVPCQITQMVKLSDGSHWSFTTHYRQDQAFLVKRAEKGSNGGENSE